MIISDRVRDLLNKLLPLFEQITFGDIIQKMQTDIESGGGGGLPVASQAEAEAGVANDKTMTPLRVKQSIDANAPGGGSGGNIVIFDPDIAATAGNRYKTFAEAYAAIAGAPLYTELWVHKQGILQTISIPAGSFPNLSKVSIAPTPGSILPKLSFDAGTTIGLPARIEGVSIENKNTVAPMATLSAGVTICQLISAAFVNHASASQPLVFVPVGSQFSLDLSGGGLNPIQGADTIGVNGTLNVILKQTSAGGFLVQDDIFTSAPGFVGTINIKTDVLFTGGYQATHVNFVDSGSDPLPINVQQNAEIRVGELITARNLSANISSPSRSLNTIYNNGSKPLFVTVTLQMPYAANGDRSVANLQTGATIIGSVNPGSITLIGHEAVGSAAPNMILCGLIPPGANYRVTDSGTTGNPPVIVGWNEQEIST